VAFRGACTSSQDAFSGNSLTAVLSWPAGAAVGDVFVGTTTLNTGTSTVTATAGANTWAATLGPFYQSSNTAFYLFIRVLDATDIAAGGVTFTWANTGRPQASGELHSGLPGTFQTPTQANNFASAAATSVTCPTLVQVGNNSTIVNVGAARNATGGGATSTLAFGTGFTNDANNPTGNATGVNMSTGVGHLTTPVASGSNVGGQSVSGGTGTGQIGVFIVELDPAAGGGNFTQSPTDDAGSTDTAALTQGKNPTDDAGVTDTPALAQSKAPVDDSGVTDSAQIQNGKLLTQTDDAGITDSAAFAQLKALTDNAGVTDPVVLSQGKAPVDAVGVTDTVVIEHSIGITIVDSVGVTDTATLVHGLNVVLLDDAGLSDFRTIAAAHNISIIDVVQVTDTATFGGNHVYQVVFYVMKPRIQMGTPRL
jgi:hypothetical protein